MHESQFVCVCAPNPRLNLTCYFEHLLPHCSLSSAPFIRLTAEELQSNATGVPLPAHVHISARCKRDLKILALLSKQV